jgi:uncharacterized membrane protein YoaK (UPF0700 family)
MDIGSALVIGSVLGAALGRVISQRIGRSFGAVIEAAACLMYAYLLNVKLCIPTATVSSALTAIAAVLAGLQAESIPMEEIHEKGRPFHVRGVTDC